MKKSLLKKNLLMTMTIVLCSYILLGFTMIGFFSNYWQNDKKESLYQHAMSVSDFASNNTQLIKLNDSGEFVLDPSMLVSYMGLIEDAITSEILIANLDGEKIIATGESVGVIDGFRVSDEIISQAANGMYSGTNTLNGYYKTMRYIVGVPFVNTLENEDEVLLGVIFASADASDIMQYSLSSISMFLTSALVSLLVTFIVVWIFSYRMIKPLRNMATAAKSFGAGDFLVRVPVGKEDEIGQLSLAFNNMANSLSNSEGIRRSFIANVSHELKTPMTTIGGFIDGILDGTIPPERQDYYMEIVSNEVKRLSRLVKSMLDLSRIDSGEVKINPVKFDITSVIFSTLITFEHSINEKDINIKGLDMAEPIMMHGDQDLMHQVVYNLIENAVKFTQKGGYIKFRLTESFDRVDIRIENSGQGVPTEDIPMIFDKFYKSDKSRSHDKKGMGLGLYLVKTILKLHGGDINVSSVEDKFTSLDFYIPKPKETNSKSNTRIIPLTGKSDVDVQDVE